GANVRHYHADQGPGSITNNQILSFAEDDHNLWVGTDGGGLFVQRNGQDRFEQASLSSKFSAQVIKCIYRDNTGNLWMGTWDGGMMRYNPDQPAVEIFSPEKKNFESRHFWD